MLRRILMAIALAVGLAAALLALCFFGMWIPNEPSRANYFVRGIDVSHHQGQIDWSAVKGADVRFSYIKATEGAGFKDSNFADNWRGCEANGIVRGAYHFFTFETAGKLQADNFISQVPAAADALPPAIDLEFSGYNKVRRPLPSDFQRELSVFWDALERHYGKMPVVYTTTDFQEQYLGRMPIERLLIREVILRPRQPWTFWQFSSRGRVSGISTYVDWNVFNGTLPQFEALKGAPAK
jgi:lysozyme